MPATAVEAAWNSVSAATPSMQVRAQVGHAIAGLAEVNVGNVSAAERAAGRVGCEEEGLEMQRGGHARSSCTSSTNLAAKETNSREQNDVTSANQTREEGTTGRFGFTLAAAGVRIRRTADAALGRAAARMKRPAEAKCKDDHDGRAAREARPESSVERGLRLGQERAAACAALSAFSIRA